jgi:hypothetical protein
MISKHQSTVGARDQATACSTPSVIHSRTDDRCLGPIAFALTRYPIAWAPSLEVHDFLVEPAGYSRTSVGTSLEIRFCSSFRDRRKTGAVSSAPPKEVAGLCLSGGARPMHQATRFKVGPYKTNQLLAVCFRPSISVLDEPTTLHDRHRRTLNRR